MAFWYPALAQGGGASPHVRHEATRVHHASWRGGRKSGWCGSKGAGNRLETLRGQTETAQRTSCVIVLRNVEEPPGDELWRPKNRLPPGTISGIIRCGVSGGAEIRPCKRVSPQWAWSRRSWPLRYGSPWRRAPRFASRRRRVRSTAATRP